MRCVIGVDVGGTKIKAGAVLLQEDTLTDRLAAAREVSTPRLPPAEFYGAIAALIGAVQQDAARQGADPLPLIALAQPGRFLPDGCLARGTTPNLGTAPGQFDGLSPAEELRQRVGGFVVAENDAIAQMRYGLHVLLGDPAVRPRLLGHTVVYLGPGTGMGGGVARVSLSGDVQVATDGHLFDLQIPSWGDGTQVAEELFTGPAVTQVVMEANRRLARPIDPPRAGRLAEILDDPHAPSEHRAEAERIAREFGEILAAVIRTVHAGMIRKVRLEALPDGRLLRHVDEPDRRWPPEDQAIARGATRFILGGFLGSNIPFGGRMRVRALEVLRQEGLSELDIIQIPVGSGDAGLLGVVRAIPLEAFQAAGLGRVKKKRRAGADAR